MTKKHIYDSEHDMKNYLKYTNSFMYMVNMPVTHIVQSKKRNKITT